MPDAIESADPFFGKDLGLGRARQLSSAIGFRRAADDVVHADVALDAFQIEEYAIVAYAQAELGRPVSQWPYVTLERFDRELVERSIDPTTITQWKCSQIFLCAP